RPGEGLLTEALASLYSLFGTTRKILRDYGPAVAQPKLRDGELSFGYIAVAVLNVVLRPILAKWHPLLVDYQSRRPADRSALQHELQWERSQELRQVLNETRNVLSHYAELLAEAARVPSLIIDRTD